MWLLTPEGFFSIVQKPGDAARGTLTVPVIVKLVVACNMYSSRQLELVFMV